MDTTWFDPDSHAAPDASTRSGAPERDAGLVYRHTDMTKLAVRVARATGRPLLLRGKPGTGKSTLAKHAARCITDGVVDGEHWGFSKFVVTSRTRAQDLLWELDAVRRLADAQLGEQATVDVAEVANYVRPGVLWWAFAPESALTQETRYRRGDEPDDDVVQGLRPRVVLIDEIDKADPDVPNDLLGPFGSMQFEVEPLSKPICLEPVVPDGVAVDEERLRPLVVITTNEERELPAAFVRRCVVLHLEPPKDADELLAIARLHFAEPEDPDAPLALTDARIKQIAGRFLVLREATHERHLSTAEFLDAIDAATDLEIDLVGDKAAWEIVEALVMRKTGPGR